MALIGDVRAICSELGLKGWRSLLLEVTQGALDIEQPDDEALAAELAKELASIDRQRAGLEDFHPNANQAIAAGVPARSLLYHVLASPHVVLDGAPPADAYPTLEQLDTIENYIYSLVADRADLADTFVAVFAYQYREAGRTPHRCHADFAYSRTGVARVGTAEARYDPVARSFLSTPEDGKGIAVLPARYGAFLARRSRAGAAGSVQLAPDDDENLEFAFPVHKLFPGDECLQGKQITVEFLEYHRNEKLRMAHKLSEAEGGLPLPAGFDIDRAPYVRDSVNGANMVSRQSAGASVLLMPTPSECLVRTASQFNTAADREQLAYFVVPPERVLNRTPENRLSRFVDSTLEISGYQDENDVLWRVAPEYVNIRHMVDPALPPSQTPVDLNLLSDVEYGKILKQGGYAAAHFIEDTCDGCVEAKIGGLNTMKNLPAFSLVAAPDFFPLADQMEMQGPNRIQNVNPLSFVRAAANPRLPLPSTSLPAFDRDELTMTAVVSDFAAGMPVDILGQPNRTISYLPDGASGYFAPGWDVSRGRDSDGFFFASLGLGSPFPEDAKLCAALSSFWPAVAPDASRTFGNGWSNQLPMLDEELGLHPRHPRVLSGEKSAHHGWDGEFGPFFEQVDGREVVNHASIERSDYVKNALQGLFRVDLTASVQSEDLIGRFRAVRNCQHLLGGIDLCLVEVRKVPAWSDVPGAAPQLQSGGYLMVFAELDGDVPSGELTRVRREVRRRHTFQVGATRIAYQRGNQAPTLHPVL